MCVRVFSVGFGPGLDSMSPARSRRSASHVAGTHSWLPQKTGRPGLRRGGVGGYNLHSVPTNSPPDCGTPTTSRLYPFGAFRVFVRIIKHDVPMFHADHRSSVELERVIQSTGLCRAWRFKPVLSVRWCGSPHSHVVSTVL